MNPIQSQDGALAATNGAVMDQGAIIGATASTNSHNNTASNTADTSPINPRPNVATNPSFTHAPRTDWRIAALIFALVWLSCVAFGSWAFNPNSLTRMLAATALAETGDPRITPYADMTIDKARFGDDYYLDKAPGMSLMAAPVVALTNWVTGQTSADVPHALYDPKAEAFLNLRMRIAVAAIGAVLTALAAVAVFQIGAGITGVQGAGIIAAIGMAMGTPLWGWTTTWFGHAATTALIAIAIWAVWRGSMAGAGRRYALIAGLALGWAVVVEHATLLLAAPVGLWAIWSLRAFDRRGQVSRLALALLGGFIAALPLFAYNLITFGTLVASGYSGVVGFEGMQQGFFGLTYPKIGPLYELTLGKRRGMIWVAPVMVISIFGLGVLLRDMRTRAMGVMLSTGALIAFLYAASYAYWDGGNATGPRHALPAVAYLGIALAAFWGSASNTEKWIVAGFLAVSIAINLVIASIDVLAPADFTAPLTQHLLPHFWAGHWNTLPSTFWDWPADMGFGLYLILATAIFAAILWIWHGSSRYGQAQIRA